MKIVSRAKLPLEIDLYSLDASRRLYFLVKRENSDAHCRIFARRDGSLPLEEASCLLAMHCLARGQLPSDYNVMAQVADSDLQGLTSRTEKLLLAGPCPEHSVKLTRREQQVLAGIVRALPNKEIAAALHVCVRTVKFHVSSLLSKFRVRDRMELVREFTKFFAPQEVRPTDIPMVNK
jgi:DNA-binding NarL/FixJ family response regulator